MRWTTYVAIVTLALLAALGSTAARADDVDDFIKQMIAVEKTWLVKEERSKQMADIYEIGQKRFPDRVYRKFAGVFNHINFKKLGDKSWIVPGMPYDTEQTFEKRGPQIRGQWSSGKKGAPKDQVTCVIVSFSSKALVRVPTIEKPVDPTDQKALLTAYYEIAMAGLAAVPEPAEGEDPKKPTGERKVALKDRKQCKAPKKKKVGKLCRWFASTQGKVTSHGRRERREWYSWHDKEREATYVLFVRFHESALGSGKAVGKGASFAKALSDGR